MPAMILTQQKRVEELPLTQTEMDAPRAVRGEAIVSLTPENQQNVRRSLFA
jgi:hypothetical protein